jgi:RNA-directed DNA polymerase
MQATCPANGPERPTDWNSVNWRKAHRQVRNLRQRIFRATAEGDWKKVHSLQKLLLRSYSNTLTSVRRVTQVNKGQRTAGVDGVTITTASARGRLVDLMMTEQSWKVHPTKRVSIPKANGTLRPLGIPTVLDRCRQARVKNALEPSWEARFEATSYGFRPGRSQHDAMRRIYSITNPRAQKKWVVDADIKGAFDNIDHNALLEAIGPVPGQELIRQWLKAGYVDKKVLHATAKGTPQGGVISPLLANIALHGMEEALGITYDPDGGTRGGRALVRYADDFVVFCKTKEDAEAAIGDLTAWLAARGLTLSSEKTRIAHLTEGFNFLGFNVKHYKTTQTKTGWKLLIKPSRETVMNTRERLRKIWETHKGKPVKYVIKALNEVIRGVACYLRGVVSKRTFRALDMWMFRKERQYVRFRHPNKSRKWRTKRYFGQLNKKRTDKWVFGDTHSGGGYVLKFNWTAIERHVMVKGTASPDDPTLKDYWEKRNKAKTKNLQPSDQKIARNQDYNCPTCGETLFTGEDIERDRTTPGKQGGQYTYTNLTLKHLCCHQQKTAREREAS